VNGALICLSAKMAVDFFGTLERFRGILCSKARARGLAILRAVNADNRKMRH